VSTSPFLPDVPVTPPEQPAARPAASRSPFATTFSSSEPEQVSAFAAPPVASPFVPFTVREAEAMDAASMLRVEVVARKLVLDQGIDLESLELSDEPPGWDLAYVAYVAEEANLIVGMVRLSVLDPAALALDQLSVDPAYGRRGIGRALLEAAVAAGRAAGYSAISFTTFRDVAFNAPFYTSMGCVEDLDPHPGLMARRKVEESLGLDALGARTVMKLPL
jgi:GNAT superfamily N-acetyltransferase